MALGALNIRSARRIHTRPRRIHTATQIRADACRDLGPRKALALRKTGTNLGPLAYRLARSAIAQSRPMSLVLPATAHLGLFDDAVVIAQVADVFS
jgi:hypothetical protein